MEEKELLEQIKEQNKKMLFQQNVILVLLLVLIVFIACFCFYILSKINGMNEVLNKIKDIDFNEISDAMEKVNRFLNYFN